MNAMKPAAGDQSTEAAATDTSSSSSSSSGVELPKDRLVEALARALELAKSSLRSPEFYHQHVLSLKSLALLIIVNVLLFQLNKLVFNLFVACLFAAGFCYFSVRSDEARVDMGDYLKQRRRGRRQHQARSFTHVRGDLARLEAHEDALSCFSEPPTTPALAATSASLSPGAAAAGQRIAKPSLSGSYRIDDELHQIIEFVLRDYCDYWYRENISNREEFIHALRIALYNAIRYAASCLRTIDWEHFIMNIVAHNLVIQMRLLKKAREKRNSAMAAQAGSLGLLAGTTAAAAQTSTPAAPGAPPGHQQPSTIKIPKSTLISAAQTAAQTSEATLIEIFYDLEAELEKNICRDNITFNSAEKEHEFVQELSEVICYSLLSSKSFECLPLRYLLREILANHLIKYSIENVSDPDYINQTLLYLCQDQATSTQNFLTTITTSDSLDELTEIGLQIDEEILKTRSYDKGGQNDQEIKQRLSSLQYVKRNIELSISNLLQSVASTHLLSQPAGAHSGGNSSGASGIPFKSSEEELKLFHQHLANIEFDVVLKNEIVQHCFIEYMGKQNVQNLISFYLNADMFRQFARKELARIGVSSATSDEKGAETSAAQVEDTKTALKDFAKGLINSYLLSAVNFTATSRDDDDQPINISNRVYYKAELAAAIERLDDSSRVNETLLDDLQAKIYLLMKQKYYPDFKNYPEFHKLLHKNDLIYKIASASPAPTAASAGAPTTLTLTSTPTGPAVTLSESLDAADATSPTFFGNSLDVASDDTSSILSMEEAMADRLSQSSFDLCNTQLSAVNSSHVVKLAAVIISVGRCNDLKSTYAIYIIDVTKVNETLNKSENWQTYRRFNDFYDLHLTIKKKFPALSNFILPGKSFRNSLSDEFLEKRRIELNRYLQTLCNPEVISANPMMLDLLLKFLENKRWEKSQTNFKRRVDSILTPMISSVQNIQTSIMNAPDNVIGMVKGISDNLLPNNVVESLSKLNATSPSSQQANTSFANGLFPGAVSGPAGVMSSSFSSLMGSASGGSGSGGLQSPQNGVIAIGGGPLTTSSSQNKLTGLMTASTGKELAAADSIDGKTILNAEELHSGNLPIRVILMLVDEVFDLKEKNQWLRQSLMAIVKSFMKNFKGDSMNKKIKEQIADYLSEEQIARYMKNFRKRMWPKGILADWPPERSRNVKEITKIMAKTKMLALVSDDLRHILGSDTTKRGVFDLFELFQHRALNKRIIYILMENLLINFFEASTSSSASLTASISFNNQLMLSQTSSMTGSVSAGSQQQQQQLVLNPFNYLVRLHLSRSARVKNDMKLRPKQTSPDSGAAPSAISSPTLPKKSLGKPATAEQTLNKSPVNAKRPDHRKMPSNASISSSSSSSSILSLNAKQQSNNNNNNNSAKTVNFNVEPDETVADKTDEAKRASMTRSKSLHNEIQC